MLKTEPTTDLFARALDEAARAAGGDGQPRPHAEARAAATLRLAALGAPTRRLEAWKYTDLRAVLARDYAFVHGAPAGRVTAADVDAARVPGLDAALLVFVDGAFDATLSDPFDGTDGVTAGSLQAALTEDAPAPFGRLTADEDAAFLALNAAFEADGPYVHVAARRVVERVIQVVHLTTADAPAFVQTRALIVVEEGAQVRIVETHHTLGTAPSFSNIVTEVVVGDRAVVDHHRIQDAGDAASQVSTARVQQGVQSLYRTGTWTFSGELIRNDIAVVLTGENSETNLAGLYLLRGSRHVDNRTLLDHAAPGCMSDELYRGIVFDKATGVFNGKVMVRREGQQTNAYQQSQGVVLSDDARHFSKPELEIYADDVKCSHGSTTGEVDPDALFYLRARGIDFDRARALLLTAFAHDVVARVGIDPLREHLDTLVEAGLA